jgi:hypothetical protein
MKKLSKMGRPPKPKAERASALVSFKTTPANHESLKRLARERGVSMSAVLVALVEAAANAREPAWSQRKRRRAYKQRTRSTEAHHLTRVEHACEVIEGKLLAKGAEYEAMSMDEAGSEKTRCERMARFFGEAADIVAALRRKLVEVQVRLGPSMASYHLQDNEGVVEVLEGVAEVLGEEGEGES